MEPKNLYTADDCGETGYDCALHSKVIVLSRSVLPEVYRNQLFFCSGGNGANPNPIGRSVFLTSLSDGEQYRYNRSDVVGVLKPELLPESAKLQLSQIRPPNSLPLEQNEPKYSGYSFLPDGRYAAGVWLCSEKEVLDYIEMQKPYQHRIMICDRDDFSVLELLNGRLAFAEQRTSQWDVRATQRFHLLADEMEANADKLAYPTEEAMEAFRQESQGGMTMT